MEAEFGHFIDVWIEYDSTEGAFRRLQEISFSLGKIDKKREIYFTRVFAYAHCVPSIPKIAFFNLLRKRATMGRQAMAKGRR